MQSSNNLVVNKNTVENILAPINGFISGEKYTAELSSDIYAKMLREQKCQYMSGVNNIKKILNDGRITYYQDLVIIQSKAALATFEEPVLIRYINLCKSNVRSIIIYNAQVLYVSPDYEYLLQKQDIQEYINVKYSNYLKDRKAKIIKYKIMKYLKKIGSIFGYTPAKHKKYSTLYKESIAKLRASIEEECWAANI